MNGCFVTNIFLPLFLISTLILSPQKTAAQTSSTAEVRTMNERIPAGGTVQVKYFLTQSRPISSGGATATLYGFSIAGAAVFSTLGDTVGTAVAQNGTVSVSVISPSSDFGVDTDYPFVTLTMDIPPSVATGSTFTLGFLPDSLFQTPTGPLYLVEPKTGTLTITDSISIRGVFPGGGTWPAGTVISVLGNGFQPKTKISTKLLKTSQAVYISGNEMQFTLQQDAAMDTQLIQASNPDGSQVSYYSYLRGYPIQNPSRWLLQNTDPIFPTQTHVAAVVGPFRALSTGQFAGLAIQNPGPGPATVTLQLQRTGATSTIILPSCSRVMDEISVLMGGAIPLAGDSIKVTATSGVEIFGLYGDENMGTVTPFVPAF